MLLFRRLSIWIENNWEDIYDKIMKKACQSVSTSRFSNISNKGQKKILSIQLGKQNTLSLQLNDGCGYQSHSF